MILILGMLCLAFAAATLCPLTPVGRFFRRALIEAPAERLTLKGLNKLASIVIVLVVLLALAAAPEVLAVVAFADLTLLVEVTGMAVLLGGTGYIKTAASTVVRAIKAGVRAIAATRRPRASRAPTALPRPKKPRRPKADPDPGWAFA